MREVRHGVCAASIGGFRYILHAAYTSRWADLSNRKGTMYLKLLEEYEKEMILDKGLKPGAVRHDARFEFALWLEKNAAQHGMQRTADNVAQDEPPQDYLDYLASEHG